MMMTTMTIRRKSDKTDEKSFAKDEVKIDDEEQEGARRGESRTMQTQFIVYNASDPSSVIILDDQEVSSIPTVGIVASLGFRA